MCLYFCPSPGLVLWSLTGLPPALAVQFFLLLTVRGELSRSCPAPTPSSEGIQERGTSKGWYSIPGWLGPCIPSASWVLRTWDQHVTRTPGPQELMDIAQVTSALPLTAPSPLTHPPPSHPQHSLVPQWQVLTKCTGNREEHLHDGARRRLWCTFCVCGGQGEALTGFGGSRKGWKASHQGGFLEIWDWAGPHTTWLQVPHWQI